LGGAQSIAGGEHLALGLARAARRLKAVVQRLGGGQPIGLYCGGAFCLAVGRSRFRQLIQILVGQARRAAHARAIAGECRRNVLVDYAGRGALGIELGIVLVGLNQGPVDRSGPRSGAHQASVGGRLGRKRHDPEGPRRGCGKRCNLRTPRNRPLPPSTTQHTPHPPSSTRGHGPATHSNRSPAILTLIGLASSWSENNDLAKTRFRQLIRANHPPVILWANLSSLWGCRR